MKKVPDPDLQFPDEAAAEERVRKMMDIAVPDEPQPTVPTAVVSKPISIQETAPRAASSVPINVIDDQDVADDLHHRTDGSGEVAALNVFMTASPKLIVAALRCRASWPKPALDRAAGSRTSPQATPRLWLVLCR